MLCMVVSTTAVQWNQHGLRLSSVGAAVSLLVPFGMPDRFDMLENVL